MKKFAGTQLLPLLATAIIAFFLGNTRIFAAVYDITTDFSTLNNPSSTWAYGYCDPDVGPSGFTPFNHSAPLPGSPENTVVGWCAGTSGWADPNINKNLSSDTLIDLYGITWLPQQVALGGLYTSVAQLRWTCPEDGLYQVDSVFSGLQTGISVANWLISKNSSSDWLMVQMGSGYNQLATYSGQVALLAGDTIDFLSHGQQHTGISATISTVEGFNEWGGNSTGNWGDPAEWTMFSVPNGMSDTAQFGNKISANATVTVDQPVTVGTLRFISTKSYSLVGSEAITLDNAYAGANSIISVQGTHSIAATILQNGDVDIQLASANDTLTLSGSWTESIPGAINVSGGNLSIAAIPAATSTSFLNLTNNRLIYTGATLAPTRPIAIGGQAKISVQETATTFTLGDSFVGGAVSLTKEGLGTLKFDKTTAGSYRIASAVVASGGTLDFSGVYDGVAMVNTVYTADTLDVAADIVGANATVNVSKGAQVALAWKAQIGVNGGTGTLNLRGTDDVEFSKLSVVNDTWIGVDTGGGVSQGTVTVDGYAELHTATGENSTGNVHVGWGSGSTASVTLSGHAMWGHDGVTPLAEGNNRAMVDIGDGNGTGEVILQDFTEMTIANGYLKIGGNAMSTANTTTQGTLTLADSATFSTGRTVVVGDSYATGILNLNGGNFTAPALVTGATGVGTINFDGGTLTASAGVLTYYDTVLDGDPPALALKELTATGLTDFIQGAGVTVNIKAGGAKIDTNGLDVTITQALNHDADGLDGGVTKLGDGQLTLSGALSYTGDTTVAQGTLNLTTALNTPDATVTVVDGTTLNAVSIVADTLVIGGTLPAPPLAAVPEPGTLALLVAAVAGLLAVIRRR